MVINRHLRNDMASIAKDALIEYFRPIKYIVGFFERSISIEAERKAIQARHHHSIAVLRIAQKAVCFNQGAYIQYTFITAEKHKQLKDAYRINPHDVQLIASLAKELMDFINIKFYESTYENFKLLHAYFSGRGKRAPRICIKGNFRANNKDTVISVFRDQQVNYDSDAEIDKNYGFYNIYKTGTYFLENNIPKAAASDHYLNPRLDNSRVKEFLSSNKNKKITEWKDCWVDGSNNTASCYKSTLVVPLTLWNNKVTDEFKRLINLENVDRTIFGFLCFDHEEENFFDEEHDVAVGYIFADMMSLYVFTRLIYMEISNTFRSVETWLLERNVDIALKPLASLWKDIPNDSNLSNILKFKPKTTSNNDLFQIDHDLLKFVQSLAANKSLNGEGNQAFPDK